MALVLADRVQETSTSPGGTGTLNLSGSAPAGFKTFSSGIGTGNSTYYCIFDTTSYAWEVGIGTYTSGSPGTLSRTTVLSNSAGTTSKINFTNGNTLNVFVTYPSEKSVNQDSSGAVNILTNVPNTTTSIGTLNVGDGTYSFSQLGQLATFASAEPIVNTVTIQNTSSSNTAYSSVQIGADNYNNGYFIELGTNSSTYSYSAAGYPNSSINQPNTNYILANKADLGIATWDNKTIHFIQNASTTTTDSMTLYASGGVSLGGNPDPGLGALYANNVYLGFTQITAAAGTTVLTNASSAWQQVVGTTTQTIQLPDATTLYKGLAFTIANNSTGNVTIKDNASTTLDTVVTGGTSILVLTANGSSAGTWVAYSYVPSSYDFSTSTANFGSATITNAIWNGTTVGTGYGGTGLTSFTSGGALYATSTSALTSGTLPVSAGGTGLTSTPANGALDIGNGTGFTRTTLTAGTGISVTNSAGGITITNTSPSSGGTVTSVTGTSPVVSSGGNTPAISLASGYGDTQNPYASKTANYFLAAPNGSAGAPTFRAIVAADIPTLNQNTTGTAGGLSGTPSITVNALNATTATVTPNTQGVSTGLTVVNGDITTYRSGGTTGVIYLNSAGSRYLYWDGTNYNMPGGNVIANGTTLTGNTGTVTSVAASAGTGISISGSPITTSGTLTITNTGVTSLAAGTGISVSGSTGGVTVTNSGVTSAAAGTGISVSGSTGGVTFTNTGVTSLVAGNGMSVSGSTGAVTITATGATLNSQAGAYVLVAGDAGKIVSNTTGGITVNNSVFSAGNIVTIYNNSGSSQTITQGTGVTLQWAGQSASTTGNRTLGLYGIATIVFLSASSAVITGSGLT